MYELNELSTQNLLDGWSLLYAKLAKNIMDTLGRAGEGVIREAVRRYGHDCGLQRQKLHLEYNVKTNLSNLFFSVLNATVTAIMTVIVTSTMTPDSAINYSTWVSRLT